jgi:hypothetical protein
MSIDIAKTRNDTERFDVTFGGEIAWVECLPNHMTLAWTEEAEKSDTIENSMALMSEVITRWDLLDNGEPIPVNPDGMRGLPTGLFLVVMQGAMQKATELAQLSTPYKEQKAREVSVPKILRNLFDRGEGSTGEEKDEREGEGPEGGERQQ